VPQPKKKRKVESTLAPGNLRQAWLGFGAGGNRQLNHHGHEGHEGRKWTAAHDFGGHRKEDLHAVELAHKQLKICLEHEKR